MMLGDTNNRFSASKAVVVLASGLLVGLFLVALMSQMLARIDALDAGEAGRMGSHPATMDRL